MSNNNKVNWRCLSPDRAELENGRAEWSKRQPMKAAESGNREGEGAGKGRIGRYGSIKPRDET
jgi:hypothetical protein